MKAQKWAMSQTTANAPNILAERIDMARRELSLSKRQVALAGGSEYAVRDIERGQKPSAERLALIARKLEVSVEWLLGQTDDRAAQPIRSEVTLSDRKFDFRGAPNSRDIPVLGTGHCALLQIGRNGDMVEVEETLFEPTETIRYVTRPPSLAGSKDAYAIYFQGDSMEPRFQPGEMAVADPSRPPHIGDDVIVQLFAEDMPEEIRSILVKRLVRRSTSYVELAQFNPALTFRVPMERVARMHRIVPPGELLGG